MARHSTARGGVSTRRLPRVVQVLLLVLVAAVVHVQEASAQCALPSSGFPLGVTSLDILQVWDRG